MLTASTSTSHAEKPRGVAGRLGLVGAVIAGLLAFVAVNPAEALVPTTVDSSMWGTNGRVRAVVETPDAIYLGGNFTALVSPTGETVPRANFAAIDPVTGGPLPFRADVNKQVWDIAVSPDAATVYAVGDFTSVNGSTRRRAAAVNATSGSVQQWNPNMGARVRAVAVLGTRVYVGGNFLSVGGQPRDRLAAVDTTSGGLLTGWTATANDAVETIVAAKDGSRILVGGNFTSISGAGSAVSKKIASVDPATGALQPWADHPSVEMLDLKVTNTQVFAAAGGSGGHAFAWDLATGNQQWTGFGDGDAQAIQPQNGVLYIGGHMTTWGGEPSGHVFAVSPSTGERITWNVRVNSALGVFSMASFQGHLSLGGDFTKVTSQPRLHYARFSEGQDTTAPTAPGKPTATASSSTVADLVWAASTDNATSLVYTIYRDGGTTPVGRVTSSSQATVSFTDVDLAPGSTHTWRVQANDGENLSPFSPTSDPLTMPQSQVPVLTSLKMLDADRDARVDTVVATFSATVNCAAPCTSPWTLTNVPSGGTLVSAVASGNSVTLNLNEGIGAASTAVGAFTVALAASPNGVVDAGGNAASFGPTAPADKAGPVPTNFNSTNGVTANVMEPGDTFTVTFSEAIDPATVLPANVKENDPAGTGTDTLIIVGLTDGPMDLLDDNVVVPDGGSVVYQDSTLTLLSGNTKIRSTIIGACTGTACGQQGVASSKVITFTPEPFLKDSAGNSATGAHTEPEAMF